MITDVGDIPTLFTKVSGSLAKLQGKTEGSGKASAKTFLENALQAFNTVKYLRQSTYSQGVIKWLRTQQRIEPVTMDKTITESHCVVRGIYHNTMFAKWWSLQPDPQLPNVQEAINARFIMNNDLSRITPETYLLPYCIWCPSVPHPSTCLELLRRVPAMKPAVARVCILADYAETWDKIDTDPDVNLMIDARESHNPKYLRDLESKIEERGCVELDDYSIEQVEPRHRMFEHTATTIVPNVAWDPAADDEGVSYNGRRVNMSHIEVSVALSDGMKQWCKELWDQHNIHLNLD